MAGVEARATIKSSARLRHLRAPEIRTASGETIRFNQGNVFGQEVVETFIGFSGNVHVSGIENLAELRTVLDNNGKDPEQAKKVMVTLNHGSHLDLPKAVEAMAKYGGRDLRRKLFILIGDRLSGSYFVDRGSRQYPFIRTPQPYDPKIDGILTEEELAQRKAENLILLRDSKRAMEYLFSQGKFGIIAPTGTRRANHEGIPEVVSYLKGCTILPTLISGSDEILPPGQWMPRRGTITIKFGKMYPFSEIERSFKGITSRGVKKEAEITEVMRRINALAPTG